MGLVSCIQAVETVVFRLPVMVALLSMTLSVFVDVADFTLSVCLKVSTTS